jgi:phosphotransferase system enzyme I (PtsI)
MTHILQGTGVSPGVAIGPALIVECEAAPVFRLTLAEDGLAAETQRFLAAVEESRRQLRAIKERLQREVQSSAYIFDAQLLMLDDPLLIERCLSRIAGERVNAEWALRSVSEELQTLFSEFTDDYLRERSSDLDDVIGRVQLNLAAHSTAPSLARLPGRFVLVAENLSPSQAAEMDWERVVAVATDAGSPTYHTAILARSLGIPGVAALKDATARVPAGATLIVDGASGAVVIDPGPEEVAVFERRAAHHREEDQRQRDTRGLPAVTCDGCHVSLQANAEFEEEATTAQLYGAEGIGLFRSEYLLGRSREWPSEEQQLDVYRRLLEQMRPHPVTVRVWDLGGEIGVPLTAGRYANPSMGERALRLMRRTPEPFRRQIRALLRAAAAGPLRIMFPFASGPSDLVAVRGLVEGVKAELRHEGVEFGEHTPIGLNVEVPSAAATADLLAREIDFFSVGTNDLIQYLLAVDRADPRVSAYYEPLHPAVLRTLHGVLRAATDCSLPVSVCGEMAADPLQALVLVGLGVRELSMSATSIPRVKAVLRRVSAEQAARVVAECLLLPTASAIEAHVREGLAEALEETEPGAGDQ